MSDMPQKMPANGGPAEGLASEAVRSSSLYNEDLAPVPRERRTWGTYNYAALWIAMSVNIPTYMLASAMIAGGMNWKQAIFTVFLGNVLVLIPMLLNAHAGAEYGIPFPIFARSAFGVLGANVPAILRALVACGWFGIQTWIGGEAICAMVVALVPAWKDAHWIVPACFLFFWLLNVLVILRGIATIRFLQGVTAPFCC
jgi:NCS1 family nucleobase:cation symporter-1